MRYDNFFYKVRAMTSVKFPVDLESLSKEDLIAKVRSMDLHVRQLRNVVEKRDVRYQRVLRKQRPFDFNRYRLRHVMLRFCYLGWDYSGLSYQEDTCNTIEAEMQRCLQLTRLAKDRATSNCRYCGRTDKGVSAFSQVVSLDIRSRQLVDDSEPNALATIPPEEELNYPLILNRVLPCDIRVIAWASVPPGLSARFDCSMRVYRYFFPRAKLNIECMQDAADRLVGEHDFRNMCKMDVGNGVLNYRRHIKQAVIEPVQSTTTAPVSGYDMFQLTIRGYAFLYHQIRCIVAVLLLVGDGKEQPDVIDQLFDVEKHPRKPQYSMAADVPLVLYDTEFGDQVQWLSDPEHVQGTIWRLQSLWTQQMSRVAVIRCMLDGLCNRHGVKPEEQTRCLQSGEPTRVHKPLLKRQSCDSLEEKVAHYVKRGRLCPSVLVGSQQDVETPPDAVIDTLSIRETDAAESNDNQYGERLLDYSPVDRESTLSSDNLCDSTAHE